MRLIYTFLDQKQGYKFSHFLKQQGIDNQFELLTNRDWGSDEYGTTSSRVWIVEEDQYELALKLLNQFEANPDDPRFEVPEGTFQSIIEPFKDTIVEGPKEVILEVIDDRPRRKGKSTVTFYFLAICALIFLLTVITTPNFVKVPVTMPYAALFTSPVYKALIFDYPKAYEFIDQLVTTFGIEKLQTPNDLPPEGKYLLQKYSETPYWQGLYQALVNWLQGKPNNWEVPLFEKIREGEIWRLFTPCLLHGGLFHIFFNMIWLLILGKQMEERIGGMRFFLFALITGIFSNTCQYLMGGANFIGFSGILTAMIGFVWARQRSATWEGYQINNSTFAFIAFFVLTMLAVQIVSFFFEVYLQNPLAPGIANTAHLTGALAGYLLGQTNFFARKIG